MQKKQVIRIGIAGAAAAVVLGAAAFYFTHSFIDGEAFPKNAPVLDLTAHTLSIQQYTDICSRYPNSQVLWTVPFQGNRYPENTESITITSLTEDEARGLDYLPNLKQVDASNCTDYAALLYLQERRPDCVVTYRVDAGGTSCDNFSQTLTVADADVKKLEAALPLLPRLQTVELEGTLPQPEDLARLQEAFPQIRFQFSLDLWQTALTPDVTRIDLTAVPVSQEELIRYLPLFSSLETVVLKETTLTEDEIKAVADRFPDTFFLFDLTLAGEVFSTDAEEVDISGKAITAEEAEAILPYFSNLQKLIMSDCGIDDETMDALNRRHPETAIVWTVQIGIHAVRTDAKVFFPAGVSESNLPNNEQLKKLRYCTEMIAVDVGHSKATECEWLEYMPHVRYLILADTGITDLTPLSNLKELVYLELFIMDITDYSPLLGCTALQDLNLGTTYGDPEPISKMTWLHNLRWSHVTEDPETRERVLALAEQLPDTNVTFDNWRNIGGPWRYLPNYYVFRDIIDGVYFNQLNPYQVWGNQDARKILSCEKNPNRFAGDVLAQIVRERIDNGLPIPGVKNVGSEKAEILYQSLLNSRP